MVDSLEPKYPPNQFNAAPYTPLNLIHEEDPEIDRCDDSDINDREFFSPPKPLHSLTVP